MKKLVFKNTENPLFCDVLIRPLTTEKTVSAQVHNAYAFAVRGDAKKMVLKKAVENLFDVKVKAVNIVNIKGKSKVFKGRLGRRSDMKKAYITLMSGQSIDLTLG